MIVNTISRIDESPSKNDIRSPFAVYEGEEFQTIPIEEPRGHFNPTEIDQLIMVMTEKLLVVTTIMLKEAIENLGVGGVTQMDIQKRVKALASAGFLTKHTFETEDNRSSYKVYKLGWRGVGYLKSIGIRPRMGEYLARCDATNIKKILAAGQYIVKQKIDIDNYQMAEVIFVPATSRDAVKDRIFRTQAILQGENGSIFLEAVRKNENWKQDLLEKMKRISAVVRTKKYNTEIKNPMLILLAESEEHMKEVMKLIDESFFYYPISILYSADTSVYTCPDSCLYEVKRSFWDTLRAM